MFADISTAPQSIHCAYELLFNISSVYHSEDVLLAELQLQPLIDAHNRRRHQPHPGLVTHHVTILERLESDEYHDIGVDIDISDQADRSATGSAETTLVVTDSIKRWAQQQVAMTKAGNTVPTGNHVFQVRIKSSPPMSNDVGGDNKLEPLANPLLVVFSDDRKRRKAEQVELHELELRELEVAAELGDTESDEGSDEGYAYDVEDGDEPDLDDEMLDAISAADSERRASRHSIESYLKSLDDGGRQLAMPLLRRRRDSNQTNDVRSSLHSVSVQGQVQGQTSRSRRSAAPQKNNGGSAAARDGKRRRKNTQRGRNSCRRRPMYVDFADIHWDNWIIAPAGYQVCCYL